MSPVVKSKTRNMSSVMSIKTLDLYSTQKSNMFSKNQREPDSINFELMDLEEDGEVEPNYTH